MPEAAGHRDALFDLAVNRAAEYALRLGVLGEGARTETLATSLELWFLRTRFASRVPFDPIAEALQAWVGRDHRWSGGPGGAWRRIGSDREW